MTQEPKPKVKMVCSWCGSDDVTRDGLLRWSVEEQKWEVSCELDNADCNKCGGEASLEEVEIDEHGNELTDEGND